MDVRLRKGNYSSTHSDGNVVYHRKNWLNWRIYIGTMLAAWNAAERNIALLNIVALAHALKIRPAKLIEPIP